MGTRRRVIFELGLGLGLGFGLRAKGIITIAIPLRHAYKRHTHRIRCCARRDARRIASIAPSGNVGTRRRVIVELGLGLGLVLLGLGLRAKGIITIAITLRPAYKLHTSRILCYVRRDARRIASIDPSGNVGTRRRVIFELGLGLGLGLLGLGLHARGIVAIAITLRHA